MSQNSNEQETRRENQDVQRESGLRSVFNKLKLSLGLIQHTRQAADIADQVVQHAGDAARDTSVPRPISSTQEESPLHDELLGVNDAIERKYHQLRHTSLNRHEETACIEAIQRLEMKRLNLMTRLHGQDLGSYAKETVNLH